MLKSVCLIAAALVIAGPALADSTCGSAKPAPFIPGASALSGLTTDQAHEKVLAVLKDIRDWQGDIDKVYYDCLDKQAVVQKAALASAKDDSAKKAASEAIEDIQKNYDSTHKVEVELASEFKTLHDAYCAMGDGLKGCAAPKK